MATRDPDEKLFRAERILSWGRIVVLAIATIALASSRGIVEAWVAWALIAASWIYAVAMLFAAPARRHQALAKQAIRELAKRAEETEARLRATIEEEKAMERQLRASRLQMEEAERRNIARELHDEIGQALTALRMSLEMVARRSSDPALEEARKNVNEILAKVRDLSLDLRPAMLDDLGLLPALLWQFERYTGRTGIEVEFKHTGLSQRFPPELETAAYRLVQEALTNVARHAKVKKVKVSAWVTSNLMTLQVEDRGAGFDVAEALRSGKSSGLAGMRERAQLLGGQLTVESAPGEGARLTAELPLDGIAHKEEAAA